MISFIYITEWCVRLVAVVSIKLRTDSKSNVLLATLNKVIGIN